MNPMNPIYLGVVNEGAATSQITLANEAPAGSLVVVASVTNAAITAASDSVGNSYTIQGQSMPEAAWSGFAFSLIKASIPAGGTITCQSSSSQWLQAAAYPGVGIPEQGVNAAQGSSVSSYPVSTSASVSKGTLVIGVIELATQGLTITQPAGWTGFPFSASPQPFVSAWTLAQAAGVVTYEPSASAGSSYLNLGIVAFPVRAQRLAMLV